MEPITHFLTGACLSRAGLNRKTGLATLTLVLASEMPDIDVVWYLGGSVAGLQHIEDSHTRSWERRLWPRSAWRLSMAFTVC